MNELNHSAAFLTISCNQPPKKLKAASRWELARSPLTVTVWARGRTKIADIQIRRGSEKQPIRHQWLRRFRNTIPVLQICEIVGFARADAWLLPWQQIEDSLLKELPGIWTSFHGSDLKVLECHLDGRNRLDPLALNKCWTFLDDTGSELAGLAHDLSAAKFAVRTIAGKLNDVPVRPEWTVAPLYSPASLVELVTMFDSFADPRATASIDFPKQAMLAMICLSKIEGARSERRYALWARSLNPEQRASLGLSKRSGAEIRVPTHHAFNKFINTARGGIMPTKRRRLDNRKTEKSAATEYASLIAELRVRRYFNRWLAKYRTSEGESVKALTEPLWFEVDQSLADELKRCPSSWMTGSEMGELSAALGKKFRDGDTRDDHLKVWPLGPVLFLLGFERLYSNQLTNIKFLNWKSDELSAIGFHLNKSPKPEAPTNNQLKVLRMEFKQLLLAQVDKEIREWIEANDMAEYLVEDGGRLIPLHERYYDASGELKPLYKTDIQRVVNESR